jgi:23S rRNA pseudouridine2605 synthase
MRLQRALARAGVASRRGAEELIREGKVKVNGRVAQLGATVDPNEDVIMVGRRRIGPSERVWIALHKPVGYVVSKKDTEGRQTVFELVPSIPGLTYVGRLDLMTSGLLLLTTDGENANKLTHPRYGVERTYRARVKGKPAGEVRRLLGEPVAVEGRDVRLVRFQVTALEGGVSQLELVLAEGRYRIVRRMCAKLGLSVERLERVSHGPVNLGRLGVGKWRYLSKRELAAVSGVRAA